MRQIAASVSIPKALSQPGLRGTVLAEALMVLCGVLLCMPTYGMASSPPIPADTTRPPLVRKVEIVGNRHFSDAELRKRIRTSPNRRILSIPGLTWWRWIYRLGDASWMWGRLGNALKSGGEPPAYIDSTALDDDIERLELFYQQRGFRKANIMASVRPAAAPNRVIVRFRIAPGPPTVIRSLTYSGLDPLSSEQKQRVASGTVLNARPRHPDSLLTLTTRTQRYQTTTLLNERRRLVALLRNAGYATVNPDSIRAIVYEPAPDTFDITMRVGLGPRYRFGDVHATITGPEEKGTERRDTLQVPVEAGHGYVPHVTTQIQDDRRLRSSVIQRSLQFTPGTYYDHERLLQTKRNLEGAGLFVFTNVTTQPNRAVAADSSRFLPVRIEARTRSRHQIRAETFALQREVVSDVENELGLGVGLSYENINALGGGESFEVRTAGSVATGLDSTLITSAQFEASTSLVLPYLLRPFRRLNRALNLQDARTRLSLRFLTARRNDLGLRIRGRGNAQFRLEGDHTPTKRSLIDVFDFSLSSPDTLAGFQRRFLDRVLGTDSTGGISDPVQRTQIIEDYTRPQVNSVLRYTFQSSTTNPLRHERGHQYEASLEVGNTLPFLLDRLVFSPGAVEYSLPGLPGDADNRLIYRPYVRAVGDFRRYVALTPSTTVAVKLYGGIAHPVAEPDLIPFDRRFFSGGASSVRGWRLRELGPGGANLQLDETSGDVANILGGDVKLESSVELRTTLFNPFLTARWIGTTFVDAGNVWFGPRNPGLDDRPAGQEGTFRAPDFLGELGVSSGVGVRLAWEYLIVRFDLAYPLNDPSPTNDDIFADRFSGPLLHFGIGHAF